MTQDQICSFFQQVLTRLPEQKRTESEEKALVVLLKEHALLHLLYSKQKHQRYKSIYLSTHMLEATRVEEVEAVLVAFAEHAIDVVTMKGWEVRKLYPLNFLRTMGDVDLLIHKEDQAKAAACLTALGFHFAGESLHDQSYQKGNIFIELHYQLFDTGTAHDAMYFAPWEHVVEVSHHQFSFTPFFHFSYLFEHLARHLNDCGAGFRPFFDIYFFLSAYPELKDAYLAFADDQKKRLFVSVLQMIENLTGTTYDLQQRLNDEDFSAFFAFVASSGVHGFGQENNIATNQMAAESKSRFAYAFKKAFPPLKKMKTQYAYLKKIPVLLPFAYFQRAVHILFFQRKKVKAFQTHSKEKVEAVRKMKERVGLNQTRSDE